MPTIVKAFVIRGYKYLGVNEAGEFFLKDEQGIWRATTTSKETLKQLDYMGEGLPEDELKKLKK